MQTEPQYSPRQVRVLVDVIERLLFASASSMEEYSEISNLDERFRYIVTRFLQKKLQTRRENNRQKKTLVSALAAAKAKQAAGHKARTAVDFSEVRRTFQRMQIRPTTRTIPPSKTSTRSKISVWKPALRKF